MKTHSKRKKIRLFFTVIVTVIFIVSCQKDESNQENPHQEIVPEEVLQKIRAAGVNSHGVVPYEMENENGKIESGWLAHDIFFSKSSLNNITDAKLFRTTNLVSVPAQGVRTIPVVGRSNLTRKMKKGLRRAVNNYNRLNLRIRFSLSFGGSTPNGGITVFRNNRNGDGAVAGFPFSNGAPFNRVTLDKGTDRISIGNLTSLITHELGHCIGLRHSDYTTRRSCRRGTENEGSGGIGAIHIPGTDSSGNSVNSVMKACYGRENGRFKNQDITALRFLY